jgi:quinol monooxygenase YgiN
MSQLTNLTFFRARPEQAQALGSALSALVAPTRAEAECLTYNLHQSIDDAEVWLVYENWCSAEGSEAHMRAPHVQAFLKVAPDLIADDIDLRRFLMVTTPAAPRA